jgi:hypothetical protein
MKNAYVVFIVLFDTIAIDVIDLNDVIGPLFRDFVPSAVKDEFAIETRSSFPNALKVDAHACSSLCHSLHVHSVTIIMHIHIEHL